MTHAKLTFDTEFEMKDFGKTKLRLSLSIRTCGLSVCKNGPVSI